MSNPYVRLNDPNGQQQYQPNNQPYPNTATFGTANQGGEQPVYQAYPAYPGSPAYQTAPQYQAYPAYPGSNQAPAQLIGLHHRPRIVHPIMQRRFGRAAIGGIVAVIVLSILILWLLVFAK